ncbi:MAG TPA: metallophosphoesterase family protein [Acidobacteriaceae bacterium]|jgi:hypothetical protein|nr:metallophosphoesterase family protein [Acidobacteriaceae bacterium]
MRIGVISDTHGLLRATVLPALQGCDHILHAGDVGDPSILTSLRAIAPVTAIRGNIDRTGPCASLPTTEAVPLAGRLFYLVHSIDDLDLTPAAAGIAAVLYGHSHQPAIDWKDGILFFNPGSAGPRRFRLPITLGILECAPSALKPHILFLESTDQEIEDRA